MRTEALIKLLRLAPLQARDIFEVMGGDVDSVCEAINDAISRGLLSWRHAAGGRYYFVKGV